MLYAVRDKLLYKPWQSLRNLRLFQVIPPIDNSALQSIPYFIVSVLDFCRLVF